MATVSNPPDAPKTRPSDLTRIHPDVDAQEAVDKRAIALPLALELIERAVDEFPNLPKQQRDLVFKILADTLQDLRAAGVIA